jgi:diadenosine tetraphosphate (Ap4A) HIT family hydrolase
MPYDPNNIFAKILRSEIPCDKVYEDEYALAFHDIAPKAPVHVLVIPRGEYISFDDFSKSAPADAMTGFYRAVQKVAEQLGLRDGGYRILSNIGPDAHQEVMHYHVHLFAGCDLGFMIKRGLVGRFS